MSEQDERRRAPRIPAKVPVKLKPAEGTTPYMLSAESINLSERGLYFSMEGQPLEPGTKIEVAFTMPGEVTGGLPMKVRCTARVVRVEPKSKQDSKLGIAAHIERFETVVGES